MPFRDKDKERKYRREAQRGLRAGVRRREPATLDEALVELRELRVTVLKQRKQIWALENKEKRARQQIQRRRAAYEQNAMAALATLTTKKTTRKRAKL